MYSKHMQDILLSFHFARWVSSVMTVVEFQCRVRLKNYA
jgi:hypothetical protein